MFHNCGVTFLYTKSEPNYDYTNVVKAFFKNSIGGIKNVPKEIIKFYGQCNGFGV